ncbi:MAG: chitobiase/beta-hexosaminidase C-terminal domain-containing protein, partial [Oscillospiraceae bacterium]
GDAVADFTGESGHTFNLTELLGGSAVSAGTFELEFAFAEKPKRELSIGCGDNIEVGGAIKYKFDGDESFSTAEVKTGEDDTKYYDAIDLGENTSITIKIEPQPEYRLEDICLREDGFGNSATEEEITALLSETGKTYDLSSDITNFRFDFAFRNKLEGGNRPFRGEYSGTYVENIPVTVTGDLNFCINDSLFYASEEIPDDLTVDYHYSGNTVDFYVECHINRKYTKLTINGTNYLGQIPTTDEGLLAAIQGQLYRFKITVAKADSYSIESATAEVSGEEMVVGNFLWRYDSSENPDDLIEHGTMELQSIKVNGVDFEQTEFLKWNDDENGGDAVLPAGAEVTVKIIPEYGFQLTSFELNGNPFTTGEEQSVFTFEVARGNFHLGAKITEVGDEVKTGTDAVKSGEVDLGTNTIDSGSVILSVSDSGTSTSEFSKEGYEISSVLDINLNQVWYKGTLDDYWSSAMNNLSSEVGITLDLAENFEEVVILHKHGSNIEEITPTLENGKLSFKTSSFSDFALAVKAIDPSAGGCFQVVYDDRGDGKVEAQIGSGEKFTASPNVWGKWYQYSDNSQAINFTVTVPADRAGQTPIIEVVNQSDFTSKTISASRNNGTYTFSITPKNLFSGYENPTINVFVNWTAFDMLSAGEDEFVVHTVNLIDENGTVYVMGAMTQVTSGSYGNESKYIYQQASGTLHVIFEPGNNKELCGFRVINVGNSETEYGFESGNPLPEKQSGGGYDFTLNISGTETEIIIEALFIDSDNQVAKPVITPGGGTFTGSQTISISCEEGAAIRYSINGGEYVDYEGEFTISSSATIKAYAFKGEMEDSDVVTATFTKKSTSAGGSTGGSGGSGGSSTPDNPTVDGKEQSWSDVANDIEKLSEGTIETISLNGNTTVPADVIKAIAEMDAEVTFKVDSVFSWTVDGADIDENDAKAADLSISKTTVTGTSELRGTVGTGFTIKGTNVKSQLNINFKATHSGEFANLFKKVDGKLVFVDNVKIDENGAAIGLEVSEKGEYVVMLGEFSDRAGDMDNDGIINPKDAYAVLKNFVGIEKGVNPLVSDMNGDGFINPKDAMLILRKFVGLE